MEINFTLVLQLIHFYIGYRLITTFLLKPVYAAIQQQQEYEADLVHAIQKQEEVIAHKTGEQQKAWSEYQQFFFSHRPLVYPEIRVSQRTVIKEYAFDLDHTVIDTETSLLAQELLKRIRSRYE
jgi:hypothetical protein